jgi:alkylation response protein AidB-like acyl-CoA dehydrogenase
VAVRVTGQKIFISGGDQDLTDNIVHLVLCRLADAPAGTQGPVAGHRAQDPA